MHWNGFTGAIANDSIGLSIGYSGTGWIWVAPDSCVPRYLTNTATSITIPAGTLQPGTTYEAALSYSRMTYSASNAIPRIDVAAFLRKTANFSIKTTGSSSGGRFTIWRVLGNGNFGLKLHGTPGTSYTLLSSTNLSTWNVRMTLPAPFDGSVTFIVPPAAQGPKVFFRARSN